jgi:hypothetical protein
MVGNPSPKWHGKQDIYTSIENNQPAANDQRCLCGKDVSESVTATTCLPKMRPITITNQWENL